MLNIVGAGMAGLIAGHFFRHMRPTVYETAPAPVQNHHALLRFRSDAIMRITGAPMRKVKVYKSVLGLGQELKNSPTLHDNNCYSKKTNKGFEHRSILDLSPVERWVPEDGFIDALADGLDIKYGIKYAFTGMEPIPVVSTIPLPALLQMTNPKAQTGLNFDAAAITVLSGRISGCNLHQTVYIPYHVTLDDYLVEWDRPYRVSIVGDRFIIECTCPISEEEVFPIHKPCRFGLLDLHILAICILQKLGIYVGRGDIILDPVKTQKRGKIVPLSTDIRRKLIGDLTKTHKVYSLGKFATWRQLLLDDLIPDMEVIQRLIRGDEYGQRLHYSK